MVKKLSLLLMVFISALAVFSFGGCNREDENSTPEYVTGDTVDGGTDEDLIIPLEDLTSSAKFFGVTVDGIYMEVIAFKSGSQIRTAFNTCQVCYGSRTAYYVQSGSYLVCQNCKSRVALSNVGVKSASYTCNPYPIVDGNRTVDDENITISYEFLVQTKNLFSTWKVT